MGHGAVGADAPGADAPAAACATDSGEQDKDSFVPGSIVGHFKIIRPLGRGGMGEVYVAKDTKLARIVALKVVNADFLGSHAADALGRFLFEARAVARFNHPSIVTIYEVGDQDGVPFIALEYVRGGTLHDRLRAGPFPLQEALRIGVAVADALAEAHLHGILHRDLKPPNIMLTESGLPKVADFGLAKQLQAAGIEFAETYVAGQDGEALDDVNGGTPAYMAPEQWVGDEVSGATDIWALGLILYEMCAGRRPYRFDNTVECAAEVCSLAPAPSLLDAAKVPPKLADLVDRCLRKDPRLRPPATDVARELEDLREHVAAASVDGSPYPGILPLLESRSAMLFGRTNAIQEAIGRTKLEPVIAIVGPSGAGKTSFLHAGLLPELCRSGSWTVVSLRPGAAPFVALASALRHASEDSGLAEEASAAFTTQPELLVAEATAPDLTKPDGAPGQSTAPAAAVAAAHRTTPQPLDRRREVETLVQQLLGNPNLLQGKLTDLSEQRGCSVLLCIDQLDDLWAQPQQEAVRDIFLREVNAAAIDPHEPIRVVFTARRQLVEHLDPFPSLRAALGNAVRIEPPSADNLRRALIEPAKAAGFRFAWPALADEIVDALSEQPAAAALLQLTATALWENRDRDEDLLTTEAYDEFGGIVGALVSHAEAAYLGLPAAEQAIAKRVLTLLARASEAGRGAPAHTLADPASSSLEVLFKLAAARLIAERVSGDETHWTLAHPKMAYAWPRLRQWLALHDRARMRIAVTSAASVLLLLVLAVSAWWMSTASGGARSLQPVLTLTLPPPIEHQTDRGRDAADARTAAEPPTAEPPTPEPPKPTSEPEPPASSEQPDPVPSASVVRPVARPRPRSSADLYDERL